MKSKLPVNPICVGKQPPHLRPPQIPRRGADTVSSAQNVAPPLIWRFVQTPPLDGEANMAWDKQTLSGVMRQDCGPTFRLFQFSEPTVSFGRLQQKSEVQKNISNDWTLVQRPTAGGIVFHKDDLCFSLCWQPGTTAIPQSPKDIYTWIHRLVMQALKPFHDVHLNPCCAGTVNTTPQDERRCFKDPVASDIMRSHEKIVGGALAFKKNGILYQGSIQSPFSTDKKILLDLKALFEQALQ